MFECTGEPNPLTTYRQNLMRECRFIDLLIDCLRYPFSDDLYLIHELTSKTPITRIARLVYRLLKHCVVDNLQNKSYVGQWMNLFFTQAMLTTDENSFGASVTIKEILKNNAQMLID